MSSLLRQHIQLKFQKDELPNFIVYEHALDKIQEDSKNLEQAILDITGLKSITHPDLLIISPTDGNYKVDDGNLSAMMKFLSQKPMENKKKWLIWTQSELLSSTILNKLLKVLEEPPVFSQIIFFHQKGAPLLSTIRSRAIFFREPSEKNQTQTSSELFILSSNTPEEVYARAKEFDEEEEKLFLGNLSDQISNFQDAQKTLNEIKSIEKKRVFHQSAGHRIFRYLTIKS